jgi:hypothetical protein
VRKGWGWMMGVFLFGMREVRRDDDIMGLSRDSEREALTKEPHLKNSATMSFVLRKAVKFRRKCHARTSTIDLLVIHLGSVRPLAARIEQIRHNEVAQQRFTAA